MTPWPAACALLALTAGCGAAPALTGPAPPASRRTEGLRAADDPTVHGARLVPLEPGAAGALWIAHGVRVREGPSGSVVSAVERMPSAPSFPPVAVPERMGGGYLYGIGTRLWRSDSWLGPVRPVASLSTPLRSIWVGLDRVYLTTVDGALGAVDAVTGALVGRGPLPASPAVTRFAALDAWHAIALADLRGPLYTADAGATWRPVSLGPATGDMAVADARLQIDALDGSRWEVRADGQLSLVDPATPRVRAAGETALDPVLRAFGERPLAAAVEDGWPLTDGTAMLARDGALTRVRLSDGCVMATAQAFPLKPSRCHPLDLARAADPGAFGFVCGEPGGATRIYRYAAGEERLVELRGFDVPREVLASGNGALAVRGSCAPEAVREADARGTWCLLPPGSDAWRELRLAGDDVEGARIVVLAGDRVALVRPPRGQDLTTARITLTDGTRATHLPLLMPELRADVARALRDGLWLDGFEERRPGVLGGWVDAGGPMLGLEIDLEGRVRVGELIREGAAPFVSGRWGFAWTASRRGFETTDGGMTWTKDLDLPEPLLKPRQISARACGPVGCLAAGSIRVGWGAAAQPEAVVPPRFRGSTRSTPSLDLECALAAPLPRPSPRAVARPPPLVARRAGPRSLGLLPSSTVPCRQELAPFLGQPPPDVASSACGVQAEAALTPGPAQITAWGPRSGEWDTEGRWSVAWVWPWGGSGDLRRSAATSAPWATREEAARSLGLVASPVVFSLVAGDDADHALLVGRPGLSPHNPTVLVLEADGAVSEVRWPGEPVPDVLAAVRSQGRWYVATSAGTSEPAAVVVWAVDGARAHELARVPRALGVTPTAVHLARRSDAASLGLVVDGQASLDRSAGPRWIVALDADTGARSDPEPLFSLEAGARAPAACTGDDDGWVLDAPYDGVVRFREADGWARVESPLVRERLARDRGCVERVAGASDRDHRALERLVARGGARSGSTVPAALRAGRERMALRCTLGARP